MSDFMNLLIGDTKKEIIDTEKRLNELKKLYNIINPKSRGGRKTKIEIVPFPKEIMREEIIPIRESVVSNIIYAGTTKGFIKSNKSRKKKNAV